jgi:hypothetical protein
LNVFKTEQAYSILEVSYIEEFQTINKVAYRKDSPMELLLSKSQEKGMMGLGAVSFKLDVKTNLTVEESELVKRYKMGDILIYEKLPVSDIAKAAGGLASGLLAVASKVLKLQFKVSDLVNGRTVKCKDIGEMIAAHEQIEGAAENFYNLLMAAKHFEGEEVITYPRQS